jgi:hypothetical protein
MDFQIDLDWEFEAPHWIDFTKDIDPNADLWFETKHPSPKSKFTNPVPIVRRSLRQMQSKIVKVSPTPEILNKPKLTPRPSPSVQSNSTQTSTQQRKRIRNPDLDFFMRFQASTRWG